MDSLRLSPRSFHQLCSLRIVSVSLFHSNFYFRWIPVHVCGVTTDTLAMCFKTDGLRHVVVFKIEKTILLFHVLSFEILGPEFDHSPHHSVEQKAVWFMFVRYKITESQWLVYSWSRGPIRWARVFTNPLNLFTNGQGWQCAHRMFIVYPNLSTCIGRDWEASKRTLEITQHWTN